MKYTFQISKFILTTVLTTIVFLFCSSQAYATGVGFVAGTGHENWRVNTDVEGSDPDYHGNRQVTNWGFVLDTRVRRDKLFGYRFTFRKEKNTGGKIDMQGLTVTHDFTFGLVRTKYMRIWMGPELKLTYFTDLTLNTDEEVVYNSPSWTDQGGLGPVWGFGIGPVVGINMHLQKIISFSFSAAYLNSSYTGDTDYSTPDGKRYGDLHVKSDGLYLSAGIIFRINE